MKHVLATSTCQGSGHRGQTMDTSLKRRVSVANLWASSRISLLDNLERYEDSYAITQEFREWITCLGEDNERLNESILNIPRSCSLPQSKEVNDSDEMIEI